MDRSSGHFFVVGCPRSGTTLLSVLLDRHSRLCVTPETAFFDEMAPCLSGASFERLLEKLQRWRRLTELGIAVEELARRLPRQAVTAGRLLCAILCEYSKLANKPRCGEKTPQHLFHIPEIMREFPDARILCLLRDGRDVALSLRSMPWGPSNLEASAKIWKRSVGLMERFSREYPLQFKVLRYEDLVAEPMQVLADAMRFLGERFEPGQVDVSRPSGVVLVRSMLWKGGALQPIQADLAGRRRAAAPREEIAFLERKLRNELARTGYRAT